MPKYKDPVGKRIHVLWKIDGELQWCQGLVTKNFKTKEGNECKFIVTWYTMPDVKGYEDNREEEVVMYENK